jgi:hypothetical protein
MLAKKYYDPVIKSFIPMLVILEIADGILTYSSVGNNLVREANPLLRNTAGTGTFLLTKITGALLCALLMWLVYKRFPKISIIASFSITMFYSLVLTWNLNILFKFTSL